MEPVQKVNEEVEEEVEKERKALVYLLVGLLIVIAAVYLYSSGILQRAAFWEGNGEQSTTGKETTEPVDMSQPAASRHSYSGAQESAGRCAPVGESSSPGAESEHEDSQAQSERPAWAEGEARDATGQKGDPIEGAGTEGRGAARILKAGGSPGVIGSLPVALVARNGMSREELRKMARDARTRYTGKTEFVLAVYADTPIGRQLANGSIRNPSSALLRLNRLLLYKIDPVKGEQFDFSPLVVPHPRP